LENIVWVYWKDPDSRQRFRIGQIEKNEMYTFRYETDLRDMVTKGFKPFFPFINVEEIYKSQELFSVFASRLPDPKRKDIGLILKKYGLNEYDSFELLKKSGGRSPIDTLEFIEPIDLSEHFIRREVYVAGVSHGDLCDGRKCNHICDLTELDYLDLAPEPTNHFDEYAVEICKDKVKIGYVPVYYSQAIFTALLNDRDVSCRILELNISVNPALEESLNCQECIKVEIIIK
jgi:hypothetical protein